MGNMVGVKEAWEYMSSNEDSIVCLDGEQIILSETGHMIFEHNKSDVIIDSDIATTDCFEIVDPEPSYFDSNIFSNSDPNKLDFIIGHVSYALNMAPRFKNFEGYIYEGHEHTPYGLSIMWKDELGDLYYCKTNHSESHSVRPKSVRFKK